MMRLVELVLRTADVPQVTVGAILQATMVYLPAAPLRTILSPSDGVKDVLLECERWRAKKLHSLAVAMRTEGATLPSDMTAEQRVGWMARWHGVELGCHLRFPRDLRWLVRMTVSTALRIPDPLSYSVDYKLPWQWRIDMPRPIQLDTVSQIASQRWGPHDLVDKLVEAGMQLPRAVDAVHDGYAVGNPTQGSLSLGGSWLTVEGEALVVLDGPYADTVWLRDTNDEEDVLWPVGLANNSMEEHGGQLPAARGTHSLLSYVEATFASTPTSSGQDNEAGGSRKVGTVGNGKHEDVGGVDESGNGCEGASDGDVVPAEVDVDVLLFTTSSPCESTRVACSRFRSPGNVRLRVVFAHKGTPSARPNVVVSCWGADTDRPFLLQPQWDMGC